MLYFVPNKLFGLTKEDAVRLGLWNEAIGYSETNPGTAEDSGTVLYDVRETWPQEIDGEWYQVWKRYQLSDEETIEEIEKLYDSFLNDNYPYDIQIRDVSVREEAMSNLAVSHTVTELYRETRIDIVDVVDNGKTIEDVIAKYPAEEHDDRYNLVLTMGRAYWVALTVKILNQELANLQLLEMPPIPEEFRA